MRKMDGRDLDQHLKQHSQGGESKESTPTDIYCQGAQAVALQHLYKQGWVCR